MRPRVVIHNEISVDGRMDRLDVDMARFYRLAGTWHEDVTLVGSETLLTAMPELASPPERLDEVASPSADPAQPDAVSAAPLLAVVDSRGRLPGVARLRDQPYWRDVIALCSHTTPVDHLDRLSTAGVGCFVGGGGSVDLAAALDWLASHHGARLVRVDGGGSLVGALLRAGLVDEVSVLIEPRLVGGETPRWLAHAPDAADADVTRLRLRHVERFDDDALWLRYETIRRG